MIARNTPAAMVHQWLEKYADAIEREINGLCADIDALQNHLDGELSEDDGPAIFARLDALIRRGIRFDPLWLAQAMTHDLASAGSDSFVDDGRENENPDDDQCEAKDEGPHDFLVVTIDEANRLYCGDDDPDCDGSPTDDLEEDDPHGNDGPTRPVRSGPGVTYQRPLSFGRLRIDVGDAVATYAVETGARL